METNKIYVSAGCGADFGLKGKQAAIGCLCFESNKWDDSIEAPSLKYFHDSAIAKIRKGKRLFLFSYDQGYREFCEEYGELLS